MIPDNIQTLADLTAPNKKYQDLISELSKHHKGLTHHTEIIICGEEIDTIAEPLIKRLFESGDIYEVKVSRIGSLYSDESDPTSISAWRPRIVGTQVSPEVGYFVISKLHPTPLHKS